MKKLVKVVAAIIENDQHEVLCALRHPKMSMANLWEFPGGKVEDGENLYDALRREIAEKLNCSIKTKNLFHKHTHQYETFTIQLITIKCEIVSGTPFANEHSKLIWLKKENLSSLKWAPADIPAVEKIMND